MLVSKEGEEGIKRLVDHSGNYVNRMKDMFFTFKKPV